MRTHMMQIIRLSRTPEYVCVCYTCAVRCTVYTKCFSDLSRSVWYHPTGESVFTWATETSCAYGEDVTIGKLETSSRRHFFRGAAGRQATITPSSAKAHGKFKLCRPGILFNSDSRRMCCPSQFTTLAHSKVLRPKLVALCIPRKTWLAQHFLAMEPLRADSDDVSIWALTLPFFDALQKSVVGFTGPDANETGLQQHFLATARLAPTVKMLRESKVLPPIHLEYFRSGGASELQLQHGCSPRRQILRHALASLSWLGSTALPEEHGSPSTMNAPKG